MSHKKTTAGTIEVNGRKVEVARRNVSKPPAPKIAECKGAIYAETLHDLVARLTVTVA